MHSGRYNERNSFKMYSKKSRLVSSLSCNMHHRKNEKQTKRNKTKWKKRNKAQQGNRLKKKRERTRKTERTSNKKKTQKTEKRAKLKDAFTKNAKHKNVSQFMVP